MLEIVLTLALAPFALAGAVIVGAVVAAAFGSCKKDKNDEE